MKRLLCFFCCALLICGAFVITSCADVDYWCLMREAAEQGDEMSMRQGAVYETLRNQKIQNMDLDYRTTNYFLCFTDPVDILSAMDAYEEAPDYTDEDVELLARVIHNEAGSYWLPDDWKMAAGEVVLNRVASPEFPDTIHDVVYQKGQYALARNFATVKLTDHEYELAERLLSGERVLNDPSIVFQANFPQGSGTALKLIDDQLGATYFCHSSHPEYYQ